MAVKIGHASLDENKSGRNGAAGDQTGREVYTCGWYDGGWHTLIRPKTRELAEAMAKACEAGCANANIGYDMNQRNTLRTAAKAAGWDLSKITTPCETDCSAFMTVCAEAAGVDVSRAYASGNAPTTWDMAKKFEATGAFVVLKDSKYTTSSARVIRGDILVKDGHVVMVLSDGSNPDRTGQSSTGWQLDSHGWWYRDADGGYPRDCWRQIGGQWYFFDQDGYMLADTEFTYAGKVYVIDESGHVVNIRDKGESNMSKHYTDVKDGAWYAEAADYCKDNGLMQGTGDGKFEPEKTVTRAELAQALMNLHKQVKG